MKLISRQVLLAAFVFTFAALAFSQEKGNIKGKVRTPEGKGISGVQIVARKDGIDAGQVSSDRKGEFRIEGLPPGKYNLMFEKDGFSQGVLYNVEVRAKKTNNLKDRVILTVDQGTLVIVAGSVFDQFGRSIFGAEVTVEQLFEDGKSKKLADFHSSQSGEFVFRFPEGSRKLKITAKYKDTENSETISVDAASIYRIAIELKLPKTANN
ncbi:MAG: carboxypeptidase-like regulatory domain-containing protein [Pyrinomonadaceae bacterium]